VTGEVNMSTQERARTLMMRHQQIVKNRQDSMLNRTVAELGDVPTGGQVVRSHHSGSMS
jgi:hypothetical protein